MRQWPGCEAADQQECRATTGYFTCNAKHWQKPYIRTNTATYMLPSLRVADILPPHICFAPQVYLDNGVYADFVVPWPPSASSDAQSNKAAADLEQAAYSAASSTPSLDPTSSSASRSASSSMPGAASAPHQSPPSSLSPTTEGPKATTNETAISRSNNYRFIAVLLEGPECRLGNRSGTIAPSSEVRRRLLERSGYLVLIIASEDWMKKQSSPNKPAADRAAFLLNRLHSIGSRE